jgi:hypothetical protein
MKKLRNIIRLINRINKLNRWILHYKDLADESLKISHIDGAAKYVMYGLATKKAQLKLMRLLVPNGWYIQFELEHLQAQINKLHNRIKEHNATKQRTVREGGSPNA